jgi:hypothetical protein
VVVDTPVLYSFIIRLRKKPVTSKGNTAKILYIISKKAKQKYFSLLHMLLKYIFQKRVPKTDRERTDRGIKGGKENST